jgi:hypothetical protein
MRGNVFADSKGAPPAADESEAALQDDGHDSGFFSPLLSSPLLAPYFHTSTVDCLIVHGPTSVKKVKLAMKVEPAVKIESGVMSGIIELDLVLLYQYLESSLHYCRV